MSRDYSKTVSVVIPVYKLEKYIMETLDCILAQTYTDWEIVLVDDNGGVCCLYAEGESGLSALRML